MPDAHIIQPSLSAGELAPTLFARVDFTKYHSGVALARNWFVDFRGGMSTRAGTQFIGFAGDQHSLSNVPTQLGTVGPFSTTGQLFPFTVGAQDGYGAEFGQVDNSQGGFVRFIQDGDYVYNLAGTVITAVTNANPGVFTAAGHGLVNNQLVNISGALGMTGIDGLWTVINKTTNTFQIAPLPFYGVAGLDTTSLGTYTGSSATALGVQQLAVPYLTGDLLRLQFAQSADVMTLTHPSYPPAEITLNAGVFSYSVIVVDATQTPPTALAVTDGGTTYPDYCWSYLVTSTSLDGKSESLPTSPVIRHYTIPDDVTGWAEELNWSAPGTPTRNYTIYKGGPFDDRVATGAGTIWGRIGQAQSTIFSDTNIPPDFAHQPPIYGDPFSGGQCQSIVVAAGGSGYPAGSAWTGYVALTVVTAGAGNANASGLAGFAVTDHLGVVRGVFLTNSGKNYTNTGGNTVTVTAGAGGATFTLTFSPLTPIYPACCIYYNQRLLFGGSNSKPDTLVASVPGDYLNFNVTPISQDTDAIVVDIAATEVDTIQSFVAVSYGCLVFTTGGIYLLNGGGQTQAITPTTASFVAQAASGANFLQPLRINWSVIYVQFRGNIVRDAKFEWARQSYIASDISALSVHLFFDFSLLKWAWAEELWRQVYVVRNDGVLLTMTYVPEQEVYGWTHYDTQGLFKSVVSIPEGTTNAVYAIVQRNVELGQAGQSCWVNYIERFDARQWDCILDAFPLDCASAMPKVYPGDPLFLSGPNTDGTYNFSLYDPCINTPPGGPSPFSTTTQYIMEAKENFDPTRAVAIDTGLVNSAPNYNHFATTDNQIPGMAYDYNRGKFLYLGFTGVCQSAPQSGHPNLILNNTGNTLWDGFLTVPNNTTYDIGSQLSPFIGEKDVNTGETVWWNTYDPNEIVPLGKAGAIIGQQVLSPEIVPNPPIINSFYVDISNILNAFYWAVTPTGATYLPSADATTPTFPYNTGSYSIGFRGGDGNSQSNVGTLAYTVTLRVPGVDQQPTVTIVDFGNSPGGPVTFTLNPAGGSIVRVDVSRPQGGTGQTVNIVSWLLSDGTWRRIGRDFSVLPSGGNNPVMVNPYTSDAWVNTFSCELYQYRFAPAIIGSYQPQPFAQEISPYVFDDLNNSLPNNAAVMMVGLDKTWTYSLVIDSAGDFPIEAVVLVPAAITGEETTLDKKLAYATYLTPPFITDRGIRGTFGTDNAVYFLSLYGDADSELSYRLTQFNPPLYAPYLGAGNSVPGGVFKDVTPWSATSGPNLDGENYLTTHEPTPSWYAYFAFYRLPAALNEAVGLFKFYKEQYSTPSTTDYTKTFISACNMKLGAVPAFDYHSAFVTGYMTATWTTAGSIPATGYAIVDVREFDTYRDQSDFVYAGLDYSKRWFAFDCYPVAGSAVVTAGGLITVLVQYQFVYGSAPVKVAGPIDETTTWDPVYTTYGTAIGNTAVVQNSLWEKTEDAQDFGLGALAMNRDNGLTVTTGNQQYWWFSGQTKASNWLTASNNMFLLDPSFEDRPQYNNPINTSRVINQIAPPFLRLTMITGSDQVIQAGCSLLGVNTVAGDTFSGTVKLIVDNLSQVDLPNDPSGVITPFGPGEWSLVTPTTLVTGLSYLEGKEVWSLADGVPIGPMVVVDGQVTLPFAAGNIVTGLLYQCQLQTLRLETSEQQSLMGRRITVPAAALILDSTLGLKIGQNATDCFVLADTPVPTTIGAPLYSGVTRNLTDGGWDSGGQIWVQQDAPLPATVLGIVSEVTIGDTGQ